MYFAVLSAIIIVCAERKDPKVAAAAQTVCRYACVARRGEAASSRKSAADKPAERRMFAVNIMRKKMTLMATIYKMNTLFGREREPES